MMRITTLKDFYVVTLECCQIFYSEISRLPYLSFFHEILSDMDNSVSLFEIKIRIMQKILPFLKRKQVEQLVDTLAKIINLPARESIYARNLNPIRCGFLTYQLIKEIEEIKGFSPFTCNQLRDIVEE